ncbi:MAG: hypothetical protein DMF61_22635 [Blastocatellia bacterium AA13]|nr:MAG: hypothetical protein DMF61_22635 [Blastocatellia bacterium AA13]
MQSTFITRDKLYLTGLLLGAGILLFLGRNLLQQSVLVTWGLTFSGATGVIVLIAALYRLRLELQASRGQLARKEAELSFALEVQRALFPRTLPGGGGLEFAAICIPARGISGDYYDVIQLPDGRLIFAIGDISGKGISAAILMANLQAVLRTLISTSQSPLEVCSSLNRHFHQVTDDSRFATFFYAEWDARSRRLTYVNAGHHTPVLVGSCSGQRLENGGFPLGMFQDTVFQAGELVLQPKDLVVLYSDGITEAESASGQEFGDDRLQTVVERNCDLALVEIQERVLDAVREWAGDEPSDDMTLLIVRAAEAGEGTGRLKSAGIS